MTFDVVTGAGPAGNATALLLAERGDRVRVVTRGAGGPDHPLVERVAADATDPDVLTGLLDGARTLYNAAAPPYHRWRTEFAPLAASLLTAVERSGVDYVMLGNAYGYGYPPAGGRVRPDAPMAPVSGKGRVRAAMWQDALASHRAGRARVAEVRASTFLGAHAQSLFTLVVAPAVRAGEEAVYPGGPDAAHSWTYIGDAARTLVAVGDARQSDAVWGRAWHVPSVSELPARDLAVRMAEVLGAPPVRVTRMPEEDLARLAATDELMAEVPEMRYLDDEPFLLDASETEHVLGLKPARLDDVLREMRG
ncbi:NAD-dependent epimerase/dehydratase family protein [Yinghuangia sp. ASG 101]|uniref:NAD-dependent epimerase/dehydratase family protein n=1 Tax=Yinghuangia sp. ASG 101 TaxID=2896848 RepID=UPI001E33E273|nr:NAD-dependent epimerase/dehydratase family protein [Yinghuangia sp. ASG 101]UGQ12045.1 NAD-dependent epimerase/dehydratase family protein [Yinghuangia sp. ASG 101]